LQICCDLHGFFTKKYFQAAGTLDGHFVRLAADKFTPVDDTSIPTGMYYFSAHIQTGASFAVLTAPYMYLRSLILTRQTNNKIFENKNQPTM
jgi:hypothetical protein